MKGRSRTKKRHKGSKKPDASRKHHKSNTPSPQERKLKQKFLAVQLKLMERSLTPIKVKWAYTTVGLDAFNKELIDLVLEKKLDARDLSPINGAVANIIQNHRPAGGVQQTVEVNLPQGMISVDELTKALEGLPIEWQDKIISQLRGKRVSGRADGSTPELTEVH